jgi:hypothetical protein
MKTKLLALMLLFGAGSLYAFPQETAKPKFDVKIQDDKAVFVDVEASGGIDPTQRINFNMNNGNFLINITTKDNQLLHLSHFPSFMINNQFIQQAGMGGQFVDTGKRLPKTPGGKVRNGYSSTWIFNGLHITQIVELVPAKAKKPGEKRWMNTVMVAYHIENKGKQPLSFGLRNYMDTYVISNDGCMFAAPTVPNKILDGMVLEGKTLPPYLQMLQNPDLKNPGYVSHLTLNMGGRYEKANKLVLSRHGTGFNAYDMQVIASMGDSGIGLYFATKEIKPGGKRDLAYAYGEGIAASVESEGRFQLNLGGSFEPGKIFTVSAVVADPAIGQSLSLELPAGMKRIEGQAIQAVLAPAEGQEFSAVAWKARVLEPGDYNLRVRSSTGMTQTKIVSIKAAQ